MLKNLPAINVKNAINITNNIFLLKLVINDITIEIKMHNIIEKLIARNVCVFVNQA